MMSTCLAFTMLLLVPACASADTDATRTSTTDTRHTARSVSWYLAAGSNLSLSFNTDFIRMHRSSMSGVFACCNFFMQHPNGSVITDQTGAYSYRFDPFHSATPPLPVIAHGMVNGVAITSGAAAISIPGIVSFAKMNKIDGVLVDYEPQTNLTLGHAQAYASFLCKLRDAMHNEHMQMASNHEGPPPHARTVHTHPLPSHTYTSRHLIGVVDSLPRVLGTAVHTRRWINICLQGQRHTDTQAHRHTPVH